MSGIVAFATAKRGSNNSSRALHFTAFARGVASIPDANGAWFDNAKTGAGVSTALSCAKSTGSGGTIGPDYTSPHGHGAYFGSGGGSSLTALVTSEAVRPAWQMNTTAPVKPPTGSQVLVYRSRYMHVGDAPTGNLLCGDGFYMGGPTGMNAGFGGGLTAFNSTTFAGIIACRMATGFFLLYKTAAGVGTTIPLTGFDLTQPCLVEHRLFQPTRTNVGRYELWINESKVTEVLGTATNFPLANFLTGGYMILQAIKDNYSGTSAGIRKWSSEVIMGEDTADTYAY